jgi:hypothetical protein
MAKKVALTHAVQPAKTTLFAGGNAAIVRKTAGAPSPQAVFPMN